MTERIQINQSFQSNLPDNFVEENPKFVDFLRQYYISQEFMGGPVDLASNLDVYKDSNSYSRNNIISETTLESSISEDDTEIEVASTKGWPKKYGIFRIDDEIFSYASIQGNIFSGCTRGFSGVVNLKQSLDIERSLFKTSEPSSHVNGSVVYNLSNLFLKDFFEKFKQQFAPGFEGRTLDSNVENLNFYNRVSDFFKSKGTDESIKILFRALFGQEVDVIKPQDYLFKPSDSNYEVVEKLVCKRISGNPLNLRGFSLYQDANPYDTGILKASGSITDVDAVLYDTNLKIDSIINSKPDGDLYYVISLSSGYNRDSFTSGTIEGKFKISPKTLTTTHVSPESSVITVDSTVSFPPSGAFYLEDDNDSQLITYTSKNVNQFIGCSAPSREFADGSTIRSVTNVYGYENNDLSKRVELVITGVLNDFESGSVSSISGIVQSEELKIEGVINGSGIIIGSDTVFGSGVVSGTGSILDGQTITGKIVGLITKSNIEGTIQETGNPLLDGFDFNGVFKQSSNFAKNLLVGDPLRIKSLGVIADERDPYFSTWIYNVPTTNKVKKIKNIRVEGNELTLETIDDHKIDLNDRIELIDVMFNRVELEAVVDVVNNRKSLTINTNIQPTAISSDREYDIRKKIRFGEFAEDNLAHPDSNIESLVSGIQNVYDSGNKVLIASESIPNYKIHLSKGTKRFSAFNINNNSISIDNHGFFSGDYVFYSADDESKPIPQLTEGYYYVIKVDTNTIQLIQSINGFLEYSEETQEGASTIKIKDGPEDEFGNPTNSTKIEYSLTPGVLAQRGLTGQKLLKFIPKETSSPNKDQSTPIGPTGIFVNGVELINYKSPQQVHYGQIEKIDVLDSGDGYDVINPPEVTIVSANNGDESGEGARINLSLVGKVEKIRIDDAGFDLLEEPIVTLKGGNGSGCKLKSRILPIDHKVEFDASRTGYAADSTISILDFNENSFRIERGHKFRDADEVVYGNNGNSSIVITTTSGDPSTLKNNSHYFVSRINEKKFRLHYSKEDAINKVNPINITEFGEGTQEFLSTVRKKILSEVVVLSEGSGYKNKKREINPEKINTAENIINIQNHDYNDGDILVYSNTGDGAVPILDENKVYQVTVFDSDNFRLSEAGTKDNISTKNYEQSKYLNFSTSGAGIHVFNYPPIELSIESKSVIGNEGLPILSPVVRGPITSVSVTDGGRNYGSSQKLINFDSGLIFEPEVKINTGSGCILDPVVIDGSLSYVNVKNGGSGYDSEPDLEIIETNGIGVGCIMRPVLDDSGSIVSVTVIYGGIGYGENISIKVVPSGSGCILRAEIQKWNINLFSRLEDQFTDDDGILVESKDSNLGVAYGSLYAPRKLRQKLITDFGEGVSPDLDFVVRSDGSTGEIDRSKSPTRSTEHSPIIGWAYDGNPIYGPYGYRDQNGGSIKLLTSGYLKKKIRDNGPNTDNFPLGFFIEDYEYLGNGDLDEHNGRFCITPEFPEGTYAYFATYITSETVTTGEQDNTIKDADDSFYKYLKPVFPYVIGEKYKSLPDPINFNPKVNQRDIDLNELGVIRNTFPYKFNQQNSSYEYVVQPQKRNEITNRLIKTSLGNITDLEIIDAGQNYKVGDKTVSNIEDTGSNISPIAEVKSVVGVGISKISTESKKIEDINIEFGKSGLIIASSEFPHNLKTNEIVSFYGSSSIINDLNGPAKITVTSFSTKLSRDIEDVSQTGPVTAISIVSNVRDNIDNLKINHYYDIGNEKVKILSYNFGTNSLIVEREQLSTVGSSHSIGENVILDSKEFVFFKDILSKPNLKKSSEFYFNPQETVGLGIVGISTFNTIGTKERQIKLKSIFIEDHKLNTGDEFLYSSLGNSPILVTKDLVSNEFPLPNDAPLYAVNFGKNLVGISTDPVRLGNDGNYVSTDESPADILYFTGYGSGTMHSLKTKESVFKTNIKKYTGIVNTNAPHNLLDGDKVNIDIHSSSEEILYEVQYKEKIRKSIFNPKSIDRSKIDEDNNLITIENHGYHDGDRIFYESNNPLLPLENETIYYAHRVSEDQFKITNFEWDAKFSLPLKEIDLQLPEELEEEDETQIFSAINPHIKVPAYAKVGFDVSHESLQYLKLTFFRDDAFVGEFESTGFTNKIEIERLNEPGSSGARVFLNLNENFPSSFYYQLKPSNINAIRNAQQIGKLNILPDLAPKPFNSNKIDLIFSKYNGNYIINVEDENTFTVSLDQKPEKLEYTSFELSKNEYSTESTNYFGPIKEFKINQRSSNLRKVPQIVSIASTVGTGANVSFIGEEVGNIKKVDISNIGFEFPSDKTLKPIADIPTVIGISNYHQIESIDVIDSGFDYISEPNIVIYDSELDEVMENVILNARILGSSISEVEVINGGSGLSKTNLLALSVDNTNGFDVLDAEFDQDAKIATLTLRTPAAGFTEDNYPFEIGEKIFVERISVAMNDLNVNIGSGYNSSDHGYQLFEVFDINPSAGAADLATVSYKIPNIVDAGEYQSSFGTVVKESSLAKFEINFKENNLNLFSKGESISFGSDGNSTGFIVENQGWDQNTSKLRVNQIIGEDISIGDIVSSNTTNARGIIKSIEYSSGKFNIDSSSQILIGSSNETGKLSNFSQRIHDNNYYQRFSYSVKSTVDISRWDDSVASLVHTSGFKRFSDYVAESLASVDVEDDQKILESLVTSTVNLTSTIEADKIHDFDLVREDKLGICSKNITFTGKIISDYFQCDKNRAISIDDFSDDFRSDPNLDVFAVIDTFWGNTLRTCKYIIEMYNAETEHYEVANFLLTHDNFYVYVNDYTGVYTHNPFGELKARFSLGEIEIQFKPNDPDDNIYIKVYRTAIRDDYPLQFVQEETISLGFLDRISKSSSFTGHPGLTFPLASFDISKYKAYNFIVQIGTLSENNSLPTGVFDYQSAEGFAMCTSDSVYGTFFGEVSTFRDLGQFSIDESDGNLIINFTQLDNVSSSLFVAKIYAVAFSNVEESATGYILPGVRDIIGIGIPEEDGSVQLFADIIEVTPDQSLSPVDIFTMDAEIYRSSKHFIEVSTSFKKQIFTVVGLHNEDDTYHNLYGEMSSENTLGSYNYIIEDSVVKLRYIPFTSDAVTIRVFSEAFKRESFGLSSETFSNIDISVNDFNYIERANRFRHEFNLTHLGDPLFSKTISPDGISIDNDVIEFIKKDGSADDHFFVTGEEIIYNYNNIPEERISTSTGSLPDRVYVIKQTENKIKLASTRSDALDGISLDLTELNFNEESEDQHFDSLNSNKKCIILIDNLIQTPISWTPINYQLTENLSGISTEISLTGITSIRDEDILKIGDEFVKVKSTNYPVSNSALVERSWMGTNQEKDQEHSIGDEVRLYRGDYNIIQDRIYFKDPPYGSKTIGKDFLLAAGLRSSSSFQGRFFQKSAYDNNVIFDDISTKFDGKTEDFDLTVEGNEVANFNSEEGLNSIVLLRDIPQKPSIDFTMENVPNVGNQLIFTGRKNSSGDQIIFPLDVNKNYLPKGGIIVSVASSPGFGYQPLVTSTGRALVSSSGIIEDIEILNRGSGYRNSPDVHILISGVKTKVGTGVISSSGGYIEDVTMINSNIEHYSPRNINNVSYDNTNGETIITTSETHNLVIDDMVDLSDITFTCSYSPEIDVVDADYDNVTGILTVTTSTAHNLSTSGKNSYVVLTDLIFTCNLDLRGSEHAYPRSVDPYYTGSSVLSVIGNTETSTQFTVNVGPSDHPSFYEYGGKVQAAINVPREKNNSQSGKDKAFGGTRVIGIIDENTFIVNTGKANDSHNYARGGVVNKPVYVIFESPVPYDNLQLQGSATGVGASVDVVIGNDSKVVDFKFNNFGYAYKIGDVLTPAGLVENPDSTVEPFTITVNDVYYEPFAAWNIGILELIIDISDQFNGVRRTFSLSRQGEFGVEPLSIELGNYGAIDLAMNLLILLDGVLQEPNKDYTFTGGTQFTFATAPKADYKCQIFFYKGNVGDTSFIDINPPFEVGDGLQLTSPEEDDSINIEDVRVVTSITRSNSARTSTYCSPEVNDSFLKPADLIKQKSDIYVSGELISKERRSLEASITPHSILIKSLDANDRVLYVDSIFDSFNVDLRGFNDVEIISKDITKIEPVSKVNVTGGSGFIVGIEIINTSPTPTIKFTFQSKEIVNIDIENPEEDYIINVGDYFMVTGSNIGSGIQMSLETSTIGISNTFIDGVYKVDNVEYISSTGLTAVYSNIVDTNGLESELASVSNQFYGYYNWGKIEGTRIDESSSYTVNNNGLEQINISSPLVRRSRPFKVNF